MIPAALGLGALALAAASGGPQRSKLSRKTFETQMILGNYSDLIRDGYAVPFAHWLTRRFSGEIAKAILIPGKYVRSPHFSTQVQSPVVSGPSLSRFYLRPGAVISRSPTVLAHLSESGTTIYVEWPAEGIFKHWMKSTNIIPGDFPTFELKEPAFVFALIGQLEVFSKEMERREQINHLHTRFVSRTPELTDACVAYMHKHPHEWVGEVEIEKLPHRTLSEYSTRTARDIHTILDKLGAPR